MNLDPSNERWSQRPPPSGTNQEARPDQADVTSDDNEDSVPSDERSLLISAPENNLTEMVREEYVVTNYGTIQEECSGGHSSSYVTDLQRDRDSDELRLLQAQVFIEDAEKYRSVDHKIDERSLIWYRYYHSSAISLLRYSVIAVLHILAFFEFPSSISWTSDSRTANDNLQLPCGVTEGIEFICLLFLLTDVIVKSHIYGKHYVRSNKWLFLEILLLGVSFVDWTVSVSIGCKEVVRVRRMLRPVFIIQNSSLMKKILNSLRKTMSQILGVLMLMGLHLYVFTLFGMLMFPQLNHKHKLPTVIEEQEDMNNSNNGTQGSNSAYFRTLADSFLSLLVLLTTANNPDVTLPAYTRNRFYALFFILFLVIGLYCFMNMLTAIIYNQFRGYFLNSMQSSLMRRRLGQRAAFETLRNKTLQMESISEDPEYSTETSKVSVRDLKAVLATSKLAKPTTILLIQTIAEGYTQDQMLSWNQFLSILHMMEKDKQAKDKPRIRWFVNYPHVIIIQKMVCHKYFTYFGNCMALINVALITIELATEYDKSLSSSKSVLRVINFLFIVYYFFEQGLLLLCLGWRRYVYSGAHLADGIIVLILLVSEVVTVALYGFPFFSKGEVEGNLTLWNFVRVINILIMVRLLRIIWHIKTMAIVAHTLIDLVKNLQSFGGILIVIYYFYAILGIELFYNKIIYNSDISNKSMKICGTYEQLEYWANNFNDFAAAIVVLWDVMVVNNWFVFLDAYAKYTNKWAYLYFIVWWLLSVVMALNLFTALILENFIMKWDRYYEGSRESRSRLESSANIYSMNTLTVHDMFRPNLKEPSEEEILHHLGRLKHFRLQT